jgi:FkbM family methyltransferase
MNFIQQQQQQRNYLTTTIKWISSQSTCKKCTCGCLFITFIFISTIYSMLMHLNIQQTSHYWMPIASFALKHASSRVVLVKTSKSVSLAVTDVSWDGEFAFLIQHLDRISPTRDLSTGYVVDLGAFDGILSSNSYNFLQLGWNGLLVEATPWTFKMLEENLANLKAVNPEIHLENVAISANEDGKLDFPMSSADPMQNGDKTVDIARTIQVPMLSVKTLFNRHAVPKEFDVLSIDIENWSWDVATKTLELGYRPIYLVIETGNRWIHEEYEFLGRLRYNAIFFWKTKKKEAMA